MKTYIVLGYSGFLGSAIFKSLLSENVKVIGISRSEIEIRKHNLKQKIDLDYVTLFEEISCDQEIILICCVRQSSSFYPKDYFDFLDKLVMRSSFVLNFNTYINYLNLSSENHHKIYMKNQERQSNCLYKGAKIRGVNFVELCLYTLYGSGDSKNSFLNVLISNISRDEDLQTTFLEQYVSYTLIGDALKHISAVLENYEAVSGIYRLWPEPPLKLRMYASQVLELFQSDIKLILGAHPYKGHELLEYDSSYFPPEIDRRFKWTSFIDGLKISYLNY
jgi:nucleoside-diphosphate-sugar epimerase